MNSIIKKKIVLCVMDGFGLAPKSPANAISLAKTKNLDEIFKKYPNCKLGASENDVGLPKGQFGNSEVGHMCIGSGRVLFQDILRINESIRLDDLKNKKAIIDLNSKATRIHLLGLLSRGGVHGHEDHFFSLLDIFEKKNKEVFIHCILDGRDSSPNSGIDSIKRLTKRIRNNKNFKISSLVGRYYAMDRDNRWDRVEKAYRAIFEGTSVRNFYDPIEEIELSYKNQLTDEFLIPTCMEGFEGIKKGDGFLITNFRADRVREILSACFNDIFDEFERKSKSNFSIALGMIEYSRRLKKYIQPIFEPQTIKNTLGEILAKNKIKQLRIAETEKYAHVTYFFNGGTEQEFCGEHRTLVPSPRVETYDLKPEMSAFEVTEKSIKSIESNEYDFIVINYANTDMVGHSGKISATIKATETIDICIGNLHKLCEKEGYLLIITSDHGNADCMIDSFNQPCTTHTLNPVPFIICTKDELELKNGSLADISPTILDLMGIKKSDEMSGQSLIL